MIETNELEGSIQISSIKFVLQGLSDSNLRISDIYTNIESALNKTPQIFTEVDFSRDELKKILVSPIIKLNESGYRCSRCRYFQKKSSVCEWVRLTCTNPNCSQKGERIPYSESAWEDFTTFPRCPHCGEEMRSIKNDKPLKDRPYDLQYKVGLVSSFCGECSYVSGERDCDGKLLKKVQDFNYYVNAVPFFQKTELKDYIPTELSSKIWEFPKNHRIKTIFLFLAYYSPYIREFLRLVISSKYQLVVEKKDIGSRDKRWWVKTQVFKRIKVWNNNENMGFIDDILPRCIAEHADLFFNKSFLRDIGVSQLNIGGKFISVEDALIDQHIDIWPTYNRMISYTVARLAGIDKFGYANILYDLIPFGESYQSRLNGKAPSLTAYELKLKTEYLSQITAEFPKLKDMLSDMGLKIVVERDIEMIYNIFTNLNKDLKGFVSVRALREKFMRFQDISKNEANRRFDDMILSNPLSKEAHKFNIDEFIIITDEGPVGDGLNNNHQHGMIKILKI